MRIRVQSVLAITPVFLLLAMGINSLICYLEYRETRWGLEEGVSSVLVTASVMSDPDAFAAPDNTAARRALLVTVRKILKLDQVAALSGYGPARRELFSLTAPSAVAGRVPPADSLAFDPSGPRVRLVTDTEGNAWIGGTAPVTAGSAAEPAGYLAAWKDAGVLRERLHAGIRQAAVRSGLALCMGIVCALIISWNLKSRIGRIQESVRRIAQARYDTDLSGGTGMIREMNDLGNSFETMASILKDTVVRGRRQLTDMKRHDQEARMTELLCLPGERSLRSGGTELFLRPCGPAGTDLFADLCAVDGVPTCFFGRLPASEGFAGAVTASAVRRYIRRVLAAGADGSGLAAAAKLFGVRDLTVVRTTSDGTVTLYRYGTVNSGGTVGPDPGAPPLVLHNLGPEAEQRFSMYCREFCACRPEELLRQLSLLADGIGHPSGILLLISEDNEHTRTQPATKDGNDAFHPA